MPFDHSSAGWLERYRMRLFYHESGAKPCTDCPWKHGKHCNKFKQDLFEFPYDDRLWPVSDCVLERWPQK